MDFRSPSYLQPLPCLAEEVFELPILFLDNADKRQKPVIAYIKNGNQIEEDLLNVIKGVFSIKSGVSDLWEVLKEIALGFGVDIEANLPGGGGSTDDEETVDDTTNSTDTTSNSESAEEAVENAETEDATADGTAEEEAEEEESAGP